MCEFSADRAGLLACGDIHIAVSALVKLAAPEIRNQRDFERALAAIDAEDDLASNRVAEAFQSHPLLIRRIDALRAYARTAEYQRILAGMNSNVGGRIASVQPRFTVPVQTDSMPAREPEPELSPEERWPWLKPKDLP